jgi:peptidyl-prolyl cis-trans isomerase D
MTSRWTRTRCGSFTTTGSPSTASPSGGFWNGSCFGTEEEAQAAFDAIAAGETDFDTLVEERDLTLADIDLGEVAVDDLPAEAAEVIFADTESEIIGPLPSRLGPALYRVNAVLEATETSFEEARADLREELADEAARREIAVMREEIDDLLASGATLEELAETTTHEPRPDRLHRHLGGGDRGL